MKQLFLTLSGICLFISLQAQNVGVGTNNPSAKLDVSATNSGILIPRVALTATNAAGPVTTPVTSMMVYNTATAGAGATAVTPGFYYWNSAAWVRVIDNNSLAGATTHTLGLSTNTLTSVVNGVSATSVAVSGVSNTSSANTLSTTVNGVIGSTVPIINTNVLSLGGTSVTSTINGSASNALDLSSLTKNIYNNDGTLTGTRAVTMAGNALSFNGGNVSIGTTSSLTTLAVNNAGTTPATTNSYPLGIARAGAVDYTIGSDASFAYTQSWNSKPLLINGQGNSVGIGLTTAPTAQLHTSGTVRFANYTNGLLVGDGTGTLTTPRTITGTSNQIDVTNGSGVSGNPTININSSYTADLKAPAALTGGGNVSFIGGNFAWSNRFIVLGNGNGSHFSTSGYFDITMPTSGTITGVGGAGSVTATASGIPMTSWTNLYYIMPVGSAFTSLAANFRIASYTAGLVVPENWILIAAVNGDDGTVKVGNGIILTPGQTWTSGSSSISNGSWSASPNMISSRDDINSSGTSGGVAAGFAMTRADVNGADDAVYLVNLGFTFYINGTPYTQVYLSTNGNIQFGSSGGTTTFSNTTLPSGSFSLPTLCYYWDDMNTTGNGLRYATVGDAGNRTFVLDFELTTHTNSFTNTGQVMLHEGSNSINVRYNTMNAYACGQQATIGLQLSTTSALPIACNAKIFDDNTTNTQSLSFSPSK